MDTEVLEELGFTNSEIKVYIALLELGPSTAGPILDKSGLHNSVVHMTLNKLIEKGLVSFVKEGKRNVYQPANPKHITDYIERKKERFEELLPEMLAKQGMSKEKPEVTVYRGKRGVKELLYELLDADGKEHRTINSPAESLMVGDAFWIDYHRKRAKKGIYAKLIFNESLMQWYGQREYRKGEIRYTAKEFEPLTETIIRGSIMGIIVWAEKPFGILINNSTVAKSYDNYFEIMWKKAKPFSEIMKTKGK